ncbi:MAG: TIGR00730 family Rossman fold protein, partial [Acidimicrobiales bacterium]
MATRAPRRRTGDPDLDRRLLELLGDRPGNDEDRNLLFEMLATVVRMAGDNVDRLNLKITNAALKEMRQAFRVFAPFREVPKITIFGSARTRPEDPLYAQARDLAATLARQGWMVVTGAGPGIMAAGAQGAGPDRSIGVNIRLPFEEANPYIAADPKLVSMKYFFTRKLMLMKESAGFVVLPGGFGTLDETFELLTLLQTGKAAPAPLVLLEVPGGTYWQAFNRFIQEELAARAMVDANDQLLYRITDEVEDAANEILGFYRNYHSLRYVGHQLVIRLRAAPTDDEVAALNEPFADIVTDGRIEATGPLGAEVADDDHVELARLVLRFDRMQSGRLRALIDALNDLPSALPLTRPDAGATEAAGSPPGARAAEAPT